MKISIGIMSCTTKEKYRRELELCLQTWIPECESVFCFASDSSMDNNKIDSDKIIYLDGVGDEYDSATDKQWLGFEWMYENAKADFYCIVGSDNYVRESKLKNMLSKYNPNEKFLISGYMQTRYIDDRLLVFPFGGSGLILTHAALEVLKPNLKNYKSHWQKICETNDYDKACDIAMAYYCEMNKIVIVRDYDVYSVNYLNYFKDKSILNTGPIDLDNAAIFHYMNEDDMIRYHKIKDDPYPYVNLYNYVKKNQNFFYWLGKQAKVILIRREMDEIHTKNLILGMLQNINDVLIVHSLDIDKIIQIYPDIEKFGLKLNCTEFEESFYDNIIY